MRFNGKDISSYWKAKATKFDTSYYSAFDRQEVKFRGLLLSYLEIPTVRKITVDILIKDRDKYLLDKTIHEMSEWLIASGEQKLFCDRSPNLYYMARCTYISNPEFAGHSAKLTVEFTCSDYRAYDRITGQPIGSVDLAMDNFTFNNKHCLNDMHCLFVCDNYTVLPKVNANKYKISGKSGTLRYDSVLNVDEKSCSGGLYFLKDDGSTSLMTPEEITEREHKVSSWLLNSKRAKLSFDSNASRWVDAEVVEAADVGFEKWVNGMIPLKLTLQPFFYDKTATTKADSLAVSANTFTTISLSDVVSAVGYSTPLVIAITNNGSSAITDLRIRYRDESNANKDFIISSNSFSLAVGATLTIDTVNYEVKIGNTLAMQYVTSGDFPVITPNGAKQIQVRSNVASTLGYNISMNVRWL